MPRITIEKRLEVVAGIHKIITETYDLPGIINYNGIVMDYDSYHMCYLSRESGQYITPEDYIKYRFEQEAKKNSGKNDNGMEQ